MLFRVFVSDSLFYYTQNMRLNDRYADRIIELNKKPTPQKSAEDIVNDIMGRHGLTFKKGGTTE